MTTTPVSMYFQLSTDSLSNLSNLSPLTKQLVSCLVHIFRQGVYLADPSGRAAIDESSDAGALCQQYLTTALRSDLASDKLFAFRRTGPSMKFILGNLPATPRLNAKGIFQLCVWRTFAFGHREHMEALLLPLKPDLEALAEIIRTWGGNSKIMIPAYGQFQVTKSKISDMLAKLWSLAAELADKKEPITFTEAYGLFYSKDIPAFPIGGLVIWLIVCDFAEYGLCGAPSPEDLANHMLCGARGSIISSMGPSKGLRLVAKLAGEDAPVGTVGNLAKVLSDAMAVLADADGMLPEVSDLVKDCERLQGRKLSIADLEHGLCKIAREETLRTAIVKKATPKEAGEKKVSKASGGKQKSVLTGRVAKKQHPEKDTLRK